MLFTQNFTFVKFRIYGDLWEKEESSDMMFIFDPQCHTLVTFFFKLAHSLKICVRMKLKVTTIIEQHLNNSEIEPMFL